MASNSGISGAAIGATIVGLVFAIGGLRNQSISKVVRSYLQGQPVPDNNASGGNSVSPGAAPVPSGSVSANQLIGKGLAAPYGWATGNEWNSLVDLWNKESGWSNTADTRKTGAGGDGPSSSVFAYGIAQARPATKYPKAGQPPDLGGMASASAQIAWGLSYIKATYGSPSAAWAHETANNWY